MPRIANKYYKMIYKTISKFKRDWNTKRDGARTFVLAQATLEHFQ